MPDNQFLKGQAAANSAKTLCFQALSGAAVSHRSHAFVSCPQKHGGKARLNRLFFEPHSGVFSLYMCDQVKKAGVICHV